MLTGWLVIREEKHVDPRYWVCIDKEDALKIASGVAHYWWTKYGPDPDEVDTNLYADQIFNIDVEECYRIQVFPQRIRELGETDQEKETKR